MVRMITLQSLDQKSFDVELGVLSLIRTLNAMVSDLGQIQGVDGFTTIPLPNVNGETLENIVQWCQHHVNDPVEDEPMEEDILEDRPVNRNKEVVVPEWDRKFLDIEKSLLIEMLLAANYLDIPLLLDYICKMVAEAINTKEVEEIQRDWNIVNDREETEGIRKEHAMFKEEELMQ